VARGATISRRWSDSMRPWKFAICACEKRSALAACAESSPVTVGLRVGSGRPITVTVTVAGAEVPATRRRHT
jgi:hypothetical protein